MVHSSIATEYCITETHQKSRAAGVKKGQVKTVVDIIQAALSNFSNRSYLIFHELWVTLVNFYLFDFFFSVLRIQNSVCL